MNKGVIFDIKRYAINDGPGIRMTVFLKGCPLQCAWCHNPESQSLKVQKVYTESKCIGAQACIEVCPNDALSLTSQGIVTDYNSCLLCGKCAEVCPTLAIEMIGHKESVNDILQKAEKERAVFDQSGGGITVSGGEPMVHYDFLIELLDAAGKKGFHRTVDTTGFSGGNKLLELAKRTELFLYDLKLMDSEKHKKYTGVGNKIILQNLIDLSASGAEINIRIPLIKGVNADDENLEKSARFIASLKGKKKKVNLLPYYNIAEKKYRKLQMNPKKPHMEEPSVEEQQHAIDIFRKYGLEAMIGG